MKNKKTIMAAVSVFVVLGFVALAWAGYVVKRPTGIATPYIYDLSLTDGPSGTVGSYYLDIPTLSANDTFCGLTTTQTLTNKTLTSPTITGATLTTLDINSGTIDGATIGAASPSTGAFTTLGATGAVTFGSTLDVTGKTTLGDCDITSGDATAYTIGTFISTGSSTLGDGAGDTVVVKGVTLTTAGTALLDDPSADAQLTTLGVSAFAKTILDDVAASNVRDTIGLGASDAVTFSDLTLTSGNATSLTVTTLKLGAGAATVTTFGISLIGNSDAAGARSTLDLGTVSTQAADSVNIDGGTIDATVIGGSSTAAASFSELTPTTTHFPASGSGTVYVNSTKGRTCEVDDGANFHMTFENGILTAIAASEGAGYTDTTP